MDGLAVRKDAGFACIRNIEVSRQWKRGGLSRWIWTHCSG